MDLFERIDAAGGSAVDGVGSGSGSGARATVGDLHKDFTAWARSCGAPAWRSNEFRGRLDKVPGLEVVRPGNVRTVVGLRLVDGQASLEEGA